MPAPSTSQRLKQPLTFRGILEVLGLLAVCAVLAAVAWRFAARKLVESRVRADLPKVAAAIRTQRQSLLKAIDAYHQTFGHYPPDHLLSTNPPVVDVVTNPLLYELAGTFYDSTNRTFNSTTLAPLKTPDLEAVFQRERFVNAAASPAQVKCFYPPTGRWVLAMREDPDISVLGFAPMPNELNPEYFNEVDFSGWRYASTRPEHNPGKFDLWIEVKALGRTLTFGNWKEAE
jgi:hypothetical protein